MRSTGDTARSVRSLPVLIPTPERRGSLPPGSSRPPASRRHLCLLSLDWTRDKDPRVPLGQASLQAALSKADVVDVTPLSVPINAPDFSVEKVLDDLLRAVSRGGAERTDIGIGVYVWNEPAVQTILRELRRRGFTGRIVLGGPQISYSGPGLERLYPDADAFIRGYGEDALCRFVTCEARERIPGLHWAGEEDEQAQARPDLSSLPSPFLNRIVDVGAQRFIRWETQRGCPYRCSFCQHRESGARLRKEERRIDLARIYEEIALFVESGVEDIAVLDPIFNANPDCLLILREFQRRGYRGRLSLQCRFESMDEAFLDACVGMDVRLEFGLQTIHEAEGRAIRRLNKMSRVESVLNELNRRGLHYEVSLIFGLPRQTRDSFLATVDFCLQRSVPVIRAFPLMLLRGTELEAEREAFGLIENDEVISAVVRSTSFTESDWQFMAAVAGALDETVGHHPSCVADLLGHVAPCAVGLMRRYSPKQPAPLTASPA